MLARVYGLARDLGLARVVSSGKHRQPNVLQTNDAITPKDLMQLQNKRTKGNENGVYTGPSLLSSPHQKIPSITFFHDDMEQPINERIVAADQKLRKCDA